MGYLLCLDSKEGGFYLLFIEKTKLVCDSYLEELLIVTDKMIVDVKCGETRYVIIKQKGSKCKS